MGLKKVKINYIAVSHETLKSPYEDAFKEIFLNENSDSGETLNKYRFFLGTILSNTNNDNPEEKEEDINERVLVYLPLSCEFTADFKNNDIEIDEEYIIKLPK